jgi:hypothetical protein
MNCKICNGIADRVFDSLVMNKYNVIYYKCGNCGFLFTENPYWLEEAYSRPMNLSDTGIISRNLQNSFVTTNILYYIFNSNLKCIDYAGGYGIFTRLMRDIGFDYYWYDPYTPNLVSQGFEFDEYSMNADFVTAFEVFEHFSNPSEELKKMLQFSESIFLTTEIIPVNIPPKEWWYYGFEHGQHISFYSFKTLETLCGKFDLNYYSLSNSFHLITKRKLNYPFLKLVTGRMSNFFFFYAKNKLVSKTWEDHLTLANELTY